MRQREVGNHRAARRCCAALLLAAGATGVCAQTLSASQLYARLEPSVWVVHTFDKDDLPLSQGSAVVIAPQTLVTNCHVLRKARRVEVTHDKTLAAATLELWDTARDLCQLKAAAVQAPAVPFADEGSVVVGQPVVTLGAPAGMELTLSAGIVSALRHDDARRLVAIQTSAAISRGSSGGGLFDEQGRLIGITTAFVGGNAQNLNLAVPVAMVRELPERHAAAQVARQAGKPTASATAADPAAPAPAPRRAETAGGGTVAVGVRALAGQWSGDYRCGAYTGSGTAENPTGWNVPAQMTVGADGAVVIVRGDSAYSETISGEIQADLSTVLKGRGAMKTRSGAWTTEVSGRFIGAGKDLRFDGQGHLDSLAGQITRRCTLSLTRNANT